MGDFQPGEKVRITIDATVVEVKHYGHADGHCLKYEYAMPSGDMQPDAVVYDAPSVTIERVAPAEWPPQPGDLWRDKHGDLWFIFKTPARAEDEPALMARTADGLRWTDNALRLIDDNAPLTRVYREEASPEYPEPGSEIPDQPGYVVGKCGHRVSASEWRAGYRVCERCPRGGAS